MFVVKVYDVYNNTHVFEVESVEKGREYAKRIITEGLWFVEVGKETFYPVHMVVKVTIYPKEA